MKVVESFLQKYYDDTRPRQLMFGINPGRHGAGITGVFDDVTVQVPNPFG